MRITFFSIFAVSGALLAAGCREAPKTAAPSRPVAVSVFTARYDSVPAIIEAPGSIQPRDRIALASQVGGYVRELHARAGDLVKQGQVLATLDSRDAESQKDLSQASIEEARAALEEARKSAEAAQSMLKAAQANHDLAAGTFGRFQKLFDARSVSPQELDEVKARRDAAAADVAARETMVAAAQDRIRQIESRIAQAGAQSRRAEVALSWTVVRAPASGRIVERSVDPGAIIFPGSPLFVLESAADPQVVADLPTTELSQLRRGLDVAVVTGTGKLSGKVAEVIPVSASGAHTVRFKVDLPSTFSAPSGAFVRIQIPSGSRRTLLVPRTCVREAGQLTGVFVVDGNAKARFRLIKSAGFDLDRLEVLSGIEEGDRIVAGPGAEVIDGAPLEVRS
jgi:multidrug resistance efflux pump